MIDNREDSIFEAPREVQVTQLKTKLLDVLGLQKKTNNQKSATIAERDTIRILRLVMQKQKFIIHL